MVASISFVEIIGVVHWSLWQIEHNRAWLVCRYSQIRISVEWFFDHHVELSNQNIPNLHETLIVEHQNTTFTFTKFLLNIMLSFSMNWICDLQLAKVIWMTSLPYAKTFQQYLNQLFFINKNLYHFFHFSWTNSFKNLIQSLFK